jgi:hypothetical protein
MVNANKIRKFKIIPQRFLTFTSRKIMIELFGRFLWQISRAVMRFNEAKTAGLVGW